MGTHPIFESDFDCLTENKYMPWAHGLFGCFSEMHTCLLGYCCPCVLFGQTAAKIGQTDSCLKGCLVTCVPCLNLYCMCKQREKIRTNEGEDGSAVMDCLTVYCCGCCALIQQANTAKSVSSFGDGFKMDRT